MSGGVCPSAPSSRSFRLGELRRAGSSVGRSFRQSQKMLDRPPERGESRLLLLEDRLDLSNFRGDILCVLLLFCFHVCNGRKDAAGPVCDGSLFGVHGLPIGFSILKMPVSARRLYPTRVRRKDIYTRNSFRPPWTHDLLNCHGY